MTSIDLPILERLIIAQLNKALDLTKHIVGLVRLACELLVKWKFKIMIALNNETILIAFIDDQKSLDDHEMIFGNYILITAVLLHLLDSEWH